MPGQTHTIPPSRLLSHYIPGAAALFLGLACWRLASLGVATWILAPGVGLAGLLVLGMHLAARSYRLEYDAVELREHTRRGVRRLRFSDVERATLEIRRGSRAERQHWLVLSGPGSALPSWQLELDGHPPGQFGPLLRAITAANPAIELNDLARQLHDGKLAAKV